MECCAKYKRTFNFPTQRRGVSFNSKVGFMVWSAEYYLRNLLTKLNFLSPLFYILTSGITFIPTQRREDHHHLHQTPAEQQKGGASRDIYESRDNFGQRTQQWPPTRTMNGNLHPEAAELEKKFSADEHGESEEKTETCKVKNQWKGGKDYLF